MQPTAQISTPRLYWRCPNRTSGARYQRVSISWVSVFIGIPKARASPKSAIFKMPILSQIIPFRSTRRFWGLRSRWMILREWQKFMPFMSWNRSSLIWCCVIVFLFWLRYFLRSYSAYSKMRCNFLSTGTYEMSIRLS